MSNTSITNVQNSDTFQVWINKTNELVDLVNSNVVLAGLGSPVEVTGNAAITGTFTANALTSSNGSIGNLSVLTLERAVDADEQIISSSPIKIQSSTENIFDLQTSSGNKPILRMINGGNARWVLGQQTDSGSSGFGIGTEGTSTPQVTISQSGRLAANELQGNGSLLTNLNANNVSSGTLNVARIPNLNADKITAGTFALARIPNLDETRIPDLNANKIATGTIAPTRLPRATKVQAETGADNNTVMTPLRTLEAILALGIPKGVITMWSGSIANIPAGWALCNGQNGTPDLRDRFVVGAGSSYQPGDTGGANSVTLTQSQLPSHSHTFSATTSQDGNHGHTFVGALLNRSSHRTSAAGTGGFLLSAEGGDTTLGPNTSSATASIAGRQIGGSGAHTHTVSGTTSSTGSNQAHENRPPYYAIAFIMKI